MGDTSDEDGSSEPPQAAGGSRADAARAAYDTAQKGTAARRAEKRDGAEPAAPGERHLDKLAQYDIDVSAEFVLLARDFECGCGVSHCVKPTPELLFRCAAYKRDTTNFGAGFAGMLRSAVVDTGDGLVLDTKRGQVLLSSIGPGVVACPQRFRSLFSIKPSMWGVMKKTVVSPVLGSIWGNASSAPRPALCGEMVAAYVRLWATELGCYLPNATTEVQLQIDATRLKFVWEYYLDVQPCRTRTSARCTTRRRRDRRSSRCARRRTSPRCAATASTCLTS